MIAQDENRSTLPKQHKNGFYEEMNIIIMKII